MQKIRGYGVICNFVIVGVHDQNVLEIKVVLKYSTKIIFVSKAWTIPPSSGKPFDFE